MHHKPRLLAVGDINAFLDLMLDDMSSREKRAPFGTG